MDETLRNRLLLGGALLFITVGAWGLSTRATASAEAELARLSEHDVDEIGAKAKAIERDLVMNQFKRNFQEFLDDDAERFGLQPTTIDEVRKPQAYAELVSDNVVLQPGQRFQSDWIQIDAKVERVSYVKSGAEVRAQHSVAIVENVHDKPLAYFADIQSAGRGQCPVRGSRRHNANALLPGERAEIVVCAGDGAIEIHSLQAIETSALGHAYVSQVPARAFGHDDIRGQSHEAPRRARTCTDVPTERLYNAIREDKIEWKDVADYFSRHNCEQYPWEWGYRYMPEGLEGLPYERERPAEEG